MSATTAQLPSLQGDGVELGSYDLVVVNSSAGKDSQAMLDHLVQRARREGVLDRLVVVHADLGRVEWKGTRELAERQAAFYGLRFEVVSRPQGDLLDQVRARKMWPSNTARYCTSDHKRGQIAKVITRLVRELELDRPARVLNAIGLRAEESPARAKKATLVRDARQTNGRRTVDTYHPILSWTERKVWATIEASGCPSHVAYSLGMRRLSCVFCVFATRTDLETAGRHNRELLDAYVDVEQEIGHSFRQELTIASVRDTLVAEDTVAEPAAAVVPAVVSMDTAVACGERGSRRPTLHLAGVNTAALAEATEGRPVLISYADVVRRPGLWQRELLPRLQAGAWPSVILDSGAFTELSDPSFRVDLEAYALFAREHAELFSWVVTLDDIRGDLDRSERNLAALEASGVDAVPVFHQGEPWAQLESLIARGYTRIGVGLQRPIRKARQWLDEVFERVAGRVELHGFGMTRYALEGYPFSTTDSTTWIAEARALWLRKGDLDAMPAAGMLPWDVAGPTERTHGLGGILADLPWLYSREELTEIVLASYDELGAVLHGEAAAFLQLHRPGARGQAGTVLDRLGAERLADLLESFDGYPGRDNEAEAAQELVA